MTTHDVDKLTEAERELVNLNVCPTCRGALAQLKPTMGRTLRRVYRCVPCDEAFVMPRERRSRYGFR